jgi:hypothetical protein
MNRLPFIQITLMLFLSGCVWMTTYETRPSVTDREAIRAKCINAILDCDNYCVNVKEYPKQPVDKKLCDRSKILACMSQHQSEFKAGFFSQVDSPCSRLDK